MQLAMIGLGKMGGNMSRRLIAAGHQVVGYNRTKQVTQQLAEEAGLAPAYSLKEAVEALEAPRIVWLMVPAGEPVESSVQELGELLAPADIVIDGGNSNFNDTMRRAEFLKEKDIHMLDAGVSGGIWGLEGGYSTMVGGKKDVVKFLRPIFEALAPAPYKGWGHVGLNGAGHFVKMVHNGIEYGLMEAYAEGFEIMKAREDFDLDLHQVAEIWRHGSVVRSWLLDLTARALEEDQDLSDIAGWVADSGEGRWTVFEAINQDVPAPVITLALLQRLASRQEESYAAKLLAAMRQQFGGHAVKTADE
jgi:6-phosphogluconate dehydrogenase